MKNDNLMKILTNEKRRKLYKNENQTQTKKTYKV